MPHKRCWAAPRTPSRYRRFSLDPYQNNTLPLRNVIMADPISLAAGLLTLAAFALKTSKTLLQTIESFQSRQRTVRELREELEALDLVLQALHDTADKSDINLAALKLPLLRCGQACNEFEAVIAKCTSHSDKSRTSFRDWAKLKYMGGDITSFKNMLAGYKSTINIALGDVNMYVWLPSL